MVSRQVVAVDADSSIRSLSDLAGKTVAVQSTGKPEEIFLSGSDPRIPQTVEVFSIENRSVQYAMLACGYVDGIAAHETGILQYMKDNAVDFRIWRNRCWSPGWASPLPRTTPAGWTAS